MLQSLHVRLKSNGDSRWVTQSPIYYGWTILIAGTIGLVMTSPGQTYSVSLFIDPLIESLGISRSLISGLYTLGTLVGSFALPVIGRQVDRHGPRRMVVVISLIFGLACILMGAVQNVVMLALGFIATRMMGQGALSLVSQNVINQWWVRKRGSIMGISGLALSLLGMAAFPNLVHFLLDSVGWRFAYVIQGLLVLVIMLPVGYFFFRDRPEIYGLQPDGHTKPEHAGDTPAWSWEENWTLAEALRTPVFWVISLSMAAVAMLSTGLFFHMVSIFEDSGLDAGVAAMVYVPLATTTALVNLGSGLLVDRIPMRVVVAASLVLQALALWMAPTLTSVTTALLYGGVLGASGGLQRTISSVVWAAYFGRRHLGSIAGVSSTIMVAGSALGPLPFGLSRDLMGSYGPVLMGSALLPLVLGIVCLFFDKPRRPALGNLTE